MTKKLEINVKAKDSKGEAYELIVPYEIDETVADNVVRFGEKTILYNLEVRIRGAVQAHVRKAVETAKAVNDVIVINEALVADAMESFKLPDGSRRKLTATEKIMREIAKLSPDEKKELDGLTGEEEVEEEEV